VRGRKREEEKERERRGKRKRREKREKRGIPIEFSFKGCYIGPKIFYARSENR